MIGSLNEVQYIKSDKLRGIRVTHSDYDKLHEANDDNVIMEEAKRIRFTNAELRNLDPECTVIIYKKMKHIDSIKTQIGNISLLTNIDIGNRLVPELLTRVCNSIQKHSDDISFYVMRVYEPDYRISIEVPEERTLATGGNRDLNIGELVKEIGFSDEMSSSADKLYRDGANVSNVIGLMMNVFKTYKHRREPKGAANTELGDI